MANQIVPPAYIGKEQAFVKHTILKAYLQRLFMVVGQRKEQVINYVDCFAGPWEEEENDLSDTSIGVSLDQMKSCAKTLDEKFNRSVIFRALYIEKDPQAFRKLKSFLDKQSFPGIEVDCREGDYTELLDEIISWCGKNFTFFFVDPKGWQRVVGAETMLPLLRLKNCEFLINLMYEFINRFVSLEKHNDDMEELFGEVPRFTNELPEQRQMKLLNLYRANLKVSYAGRTAYVPVNRPGIDRVFYYLVYLTRHPKGIEIFKTEAEGIEVVQRITREEIRLRKQIEASESQDMFGDELEVNSTTHEYSDNRYAAMEYLLSKLSSDPLLIDIEIWANFLEESEFYPSDFQMAMKELIKSGQVLNLDADPSRRKKYFIKPDWSNKSERWVMKQ